MLFWRGHDCQGCRGSEKELAVHYLRDSELGTADETWYQVITNALSVVWKACEACRWENPETEFPVGAGKFALRSSKDAGSKVPVREKFQAQTVKSLYCVAARSTKAGFNGICNPRTQKLMGQSSAAPRSEVSKLTQFLLWWYWDWRRSASSHASGMASTHWIFFSRPSASTTLWHWEKLSTNEYSIYHWPLWQAEPRPFRHSQPHGNPYGARIYWKL